MKRISVFIGEPQYQQFLELANVKGRPYAELIREALDDYLRTQTRERRIGKTERGRARTRRRS